METGRKKVVQWAKEHKKAMITTVVTVSVFTVGATIFLVTRNRKVSSNVTKVINDLSQKPNEAVNVVLENVQRQSPCKHHVGDFIRQLHDGQHASKRALDYADTKGIILNIGETIVREHDRGGNKAA